MSVCVSTSNAIHDTKTLIEIQTDAGLIALKSLVKKYTYELDDTIRIGLDNILAYTHGILGQIILME